MSMQREDPPDFLLMPILPIWRWKVVKYPDFVIKPGEEFVLWDEKRAGWLYWCFITCNSPDLIISMDLEVTPEILDIRLTPKQLYEWGFTQGDGDFKVLRYDDAAKVYTVRFSPGTFNALGTPFRERCKAWLTNPTTSDITFTVQAWLILLRWVPRP